MYNQIKNLFLIAGVSLLLLNSCKKWEDHNGITDDHIAQNLFERIQGNPDLSSFAGLLAKSGYADTLASSRVFTVYAPSNAALSSVAASLESDMAALKQFVANHIANQARYAQSTEGLQRIPVLNGKYHNLSAIAIDDVIFSSKDLAAQNGVVQVIGAPLLVLNNTWAFAETDARMPVLQKVAMVDSLGSLFRTRAHNLRDESKNFTLFVLQDGAWQSEINRFKPFSNVPGNADSTIKVAGWLVVKDLAVDTLYKTAADIPDTIISRSGVRVGIDKSAIVSSVKTSNGVVYIMNKLEVPFRNKFRDIIVEAENYTSASANRLSNTYIREKRDSATGGTFKDVLVYNHGLAQFNLRYRLTEVPAVKYRVYWMALNDNINNMTAPFTQKIGVDSFNSPLPAYVTVPLNTYAEQLAGEFTLTNFRPGFNLFLTAANNATANTSAIVCNYIRLQPVF
ncbi:fasciclin domain-containing protein [Niabella hibiscisoli]|uniref:fasciclin domain-containing protein n=1 Tax=Niabella hibiscisoli TaxID=1825928 RepID=UPI001F0EE32A|nr:fasciclin domain-containing protein [Niabella hibiscisoli]MCH5717988.1 fasciclin domain-containing protein [Niabella hibiscisoli]